MSWKPFMRFVALVYGQLDLLLVVDKSKSRLHLYLVKQCFFDPNSQGIAEANGMVASVPLQLPKPGQNGLAQQDVPAFLKVGTCHYYWKETILPDAGVSPITDVEFDTVDVEWDWGKLDPADVVKTPGNWSFPIRYSEWVTGGSDYDKSADAGKWGAGIAVSSWLTAADLKSCGVRMPKQFRLDKGYAKMVFLTQSTIPGGKAVVLTDVTSEYEKLNWLNDPVNKAPPAPVIVVDALLPATKPGKPGKPLKARMLDLGSKSTSTFFAVRFGFDVQPDDFVSAGVTTKAFPWGVAAVAIEIEGDY